MDDSLFSPSVVSRLTSVVVSLSSRPAAESDRPFLRAFIREHWGADEMIDRERVMVPAENPAFIAESEGEVVGVATYEVRDGDCEVTSLNSLRREQGIGGALMDAVIAEAKAKKCGRVWLLTTNDNLNALQFYQKLGLRLVALYPNAVDEARKRKPEIPEIGQNGIPLRDEIELELIF
ncbi:MAG TPA: GNAT family N-acetyltransferase [Anaerolineales bacterium]|nr:GNAT family N-acetyltransferase [Anaerolineales bacterium]